MRLDDATPKPVSEFANAAMLNNATFHDYYKRIRLLALTMFEWENLPYSMDARYLERSLYYFGLACFCPTFRFGWLSLPCLPSAEMNIYGESIRYTAYSNSSNFQREYNRSDIVLVRNNLEAIPTDLTVRLFARRLYEAERAIDTNIKAQKTPTLIVCDEKQRLTLQQIYQKYDGNEPVIFGNKALDVSGVSVLKTDAPYVADRLIQYKQNVWSDVLSFLGVNSTPYEKSAQLTSNEVNSNIQMLMLSAQTMLATRQDAARQYNEKTGSNISVKLRSINDSDVINQLKQVLSDDAPEPADDNDSEREAV